MKQDIITMERFIGKEEEGIYFTLPFEVPKDVERLDIAYYYPRFLSEQREDGSTVTREENIIDFGLCSAGENYIGSSGSDRNSITITAVKSSQGFAPADIKPGRWNIIIGAYKVQEDGVAVVYRITFTMKERRLLKGDTHIHTLGSDGSLSLKDAAWLGRQRGLDYIIVTDHNNYAQNFQEAGVEGITVIPGMEWTHYKGHAGILGVKKPFENAFCVNSLKEARNKLAEAKANGAFLVLNHPFCPNCGWKWGMEHFDYDAVEVWNGSLFASSNLACLEWWHKQLLTGKKIPVVGGSDFHRPDFAGMIGSPCTCVYAMSCSPEDILNALRNGNCYITVSVQGPDIYAEAGGRIMGETALPGSELHAGFRNLKGCDIIRLITDCGTEDIVCENGIQEWEISRRYEKHAFCRFEIWRKLTPELPPMPVLLSNPIYFGFSDSASGTPSA